MSKLDITKGLQGDIIILRLTLVLLLLRALGDEDEEREHLLEVDALPAAPAAHAAVHHGANAAAVPDPCDAKRGEEETKLHSTAKSD